MAVNLLHGRRTANMPVLKSARKKREDSLHVRSELVWVIESPETRDRLQHLYMELYIHESILQAKKPLELYPL